MQEQQNAIVETWWAATSQREFVDWLDEYGRAKDSNYAQARPMNMEWGMAWYHYVPGSSGGSIYFVVNTEAPATFGAGLLRITATLFTGYDEDTGKPVFSGSPGSVAYFQGLRESIERRFPAQNMPGALRNALLQPVKLTKREIDVAQHLVEGLSDRGIAEHLMIGESTAKRHRQNIAKKLECSETPEIVRMELQRRGYI